MLAAISYVVDEIEHLHAISFMTLENNKTVANNMLWKKKKKQAIFDFRTGKLGCRLPGYVSSYYSCCSHLISSFSGMKPGSCSEESVTRNLVAKPHGN